jgi:hypothetical protein
LPCVLRIDLGFSRGRLLFIGGSFFVEISMWQFSEGSVPDEHPSELRHFGNVGVICFAEELRLNLNRAPN